MKKIKKWIWDIFTEPGNDTVCPVRVLAFIGFFYFLGSHAWSVFGLSVTMNLQEFGIAFSAMMATVGTALGLKTDSPEGTGGNNASGN